MVENNKTARLSYPGYQKVKVLLINPYWEKKEGGIWKEVASCALPVGLGIIAACLEKAGVLVKIFDASASGMDNNNFRDIITKERFDYFGITSTSFIFAEAVKIASICKTCCPESKVIFGGVHPTILPEDVLNNKHVDYVVRGEGEVSMVELVKTANPESVAGVSYRQNGKVIHNPARPLIKNLDSLPFPAYHLFPMKKYHPALGGYRRTPAINMISSRGCLGKCTFCYKDMFGVMTRMRSPENLVEEIELLTGNYGIKEITFYDDSFIVSKKG